jgi:hypothetical protein
MAHDRPLFHSKADLQHALAVLGQRARLDRHDVTPRERTRCLLDFRFRLPAPLSAPAEGVLLRERQRPP